MANNLFSAKFATICSLLVAPHVPLQMPQADRVPEQGEPSQTSTKTPQPTSTAQPSGNFMNILIVFLDKLIADPRQTGALANKIVRRMPQMVETKVSIAKKEITSQVRKS